MKVHHLNCGSMKLVGAPLVCHVLAVETNSGLVLVDTGFGLSDIADPKKRIGVFRHLGQPELVEHETALRQVEALGFRRDDVRHIVLTHLDLDHIGGIADFPDAVVHVTSAEALGAMHAPSRRERLRFRPAQWAHGPKLVEHEPEGELWRGFAAAKSLDEISPGIVLVSYGSIRRAPMSSSRCRRHRFCPSGPPHGKPGRQPSTTGKTYQTAVRRADTARRAVRGGCRGPRGWSGVHGQYQATGSADTSPRC